MNKYGSNTIANGNLDLISSPAKEVSQKGFLEVALHHRWIILSTTVLFLAGAFFYLVKATPIYTSTARLYVEQSGPRIITDYEGVMTQSKNYLHTQCELIKSTPIVAAVVDDAQIKRFRTFSKIDNLVAYVKKVLNVAVGRKDDIITVSFDSPHPTEAAQVVNAVVDSYIEYHSTRKRSTVSEVLRILQKEKVKRDKELSEKFGQMLEFTRENGVVSLDNRGGHIVFQRLAKLSEALTEAQLAAIKAKADYEATKSMASEPAKIKQLAMAEPTAGVHISVNDEETRLWSQMEDLEIESRNMKYHCTEEHPFVRSIHAKIDHIKERIQSRRKEFAEAYIEVMRQRWTTAKQREGELLASFDAQRQEAQNMGVKATEYSVLESELKRTERLCEILDERIKELNVTEDTGALNISILEVARVEDKPSKPQKARVLAISLALGFMLGCGLALLRDRLDYRLRSAEEISAVLGIPVLGAVPTMSERQTIAARGQRVWLDFKVVVTDVYRTIRGAVFSGIPQAKSKTSVVASAAGGDSRTPSGEQAISDCGRKMQLKFKPIVAKACSTVRSSAPAGAPEGKANIVDVTSPANDKASFKKKTSGGHGRRALLESKSTIAETYQARLATAFFGAPKDESKTTVVSSPAPTDDEATSRERTMAERGQEVRLKPRSIVAEAYRTIRTAVFFGVPKGKAKTIVVTSPAPGDGKTTLVSNLAIAMAQAGQRTLILDCDFRKPRQHNIFQIDNAKGASSVFAGSITLDEAIRRGPVEGLDLLPCGPEVPNPSEILNSEVFVEMLEELSQRYERVIIDSPPAMPVADSQILGAICDITLLVLRAEKSTRKLSQQALDSLMSIGAHVLGAVVNDVPRASGRYGYYSGYRYYGHYGYYGYGHREKKKESQQKPEAVIESVAFDTISCNEVRT